MRSHTKEERFIIAAYQEALQTGELDITLDRYVIGTLVGLSQRGVDAAFKLFVRSNFVKGRIGESDFRLTDQGVRLALQLLEE